MRWHRLWINFGRSSVVLYREWFEDCREARHWARTEVDMLGLRLDTDWADLHCSATPLAEGCRQNVECLPAEGLLLDHEEQHHA